jgi:CCR4-NOT transcription complex subunit 6
VEFNQLAMANADGLDHMLNRVMPKDNIGLAALLQTTEAAWENSESGRGDLFVMMVTRCLL